MPILTATETGAAMNVISANVIVSKSFALKSCPLVGVNFYIAGADDSTHQIPLSQGAGSPELNQRAI